MGLEIELMTINEYDEVLALWQDSEGVGLSGADSRVPLARFLERNPDLCFVAFMDTVLVGAVLCGYDGRRGYLHHLAVHRDHRRCGIGRKLVERCLKELKEMGVQKCHLFVFKKNKEGIAFWKKMGWKTRTELSIMSREV
jgi:N-acetylglutamate synthase